MGRCLLWGRETNEEAGGGRGWGVKGDRRILPLDNFLLFECLRILLFVEHAGQVVMLKPISQ